jgi:hypothetical protein
MTTLKGLASMVVVLAILLIPRSASLLETEVRHRESPTWPGISCLVRLDHPSWIKGL